MVCFLTNLFKLGKLEVKLVCAILRVLQRLLQAVYAIIVLDLLLKLADPALVTLGI